MNLVVPNPKASKGQSQSSNPKLVDFTECVLLASLPPVIRGKQQAEEDYLPTNHGANCEWNSVKQSTELSSLPALICGFSCSAGETNHEYSFHYLLSIHLSPNIP